MAVLTVFSNNLNPSNGSLTARFTRANGFYIDAPLISAEIEIDVFLQVYFPTATGERVRKLDLGKLKDGEIKLNEVDSESLITIPQEYVDSGLEMALFFLPSDTTFLEVYVVGADCTLCQLNQRIEALEQTVADLKNQLSSDNELFELALNLILNSLGLSLPSLPVAMSGTNHSNYFNTGFI